MRRAVITGFGVISSIGNNKEEVLASLKAGKSGIVATPEFIEANMRSKMESLSAIIAGFRKRGMKTCAYGWPPC